MVAVLYTKRLALRPQSVADIADHHALLADPAAGRFAPPPVSSARGSEQQLTRVLARQAAGELLSWGIRPDDGPLVGVVALVRIAREHRRSEVGYRLRSDHRGQGFMTEALSRLAEHAFQDLGFHRLAGHTSSDNQSSIAVLGRCGFRFEGVLREDYFMNGVFHDSAVYARLADAPLPPAGEP